MAISNMFSYDIHRIVWSPLQEILGVYLMVKAYAKTCTSCGVIFYCGGLNCIGTVDHTACYCVICSLEEKTEALIDNIKKCPKSNSKEDIIELLTVETL
jgi:hypothetical protein